MSKTTNHILRKKVSPFSPKYAEEKEKADRTESEREANGGRTFGDGTTTTRPNTNDTTTKPDKQSIIGNIDLRDIKRTSYEGYVEHIKIFNKLKQETNGKFNVSKFIRDTIDEKLKELGLL